jgi:methyl-accepting chemotaxis protein
MKLLTKFNLVLAIIFAGGGILISGMAYRFLIDNARREVLAQAELMMAGAKSVRDYTSTDLSPLLQQNPRYKLRFIPETVPAFGATTIFSNLRKNYPDYSYKEATLNPTNLEDRASDWEADVIRDMRDHPEKDSIVGQRVTASGEALYLAKPLIVNLPACLQCHSVPSAAPVAMLAVYGSANGFGWKNGETIGAQVVSVPMSVPLEIAKRAYQRLLIFLILTSLAAILALDASVYWFVSRPLKTLSDVADRVSKGEKDVPRLAVKGKDEVATVTASFNRMQVSLAKAFELLEEH